MRAAPPGMEMALIPAWATLAGLLADGELDALCTPWSYGELFAAGTREEYVI